MRHSPAEARGLRLERITAETSLLRSYVSFSARFARLSVGFFSSREDFSMFGCGYAALCLCGSNFSQALARDLRDRLAEYAHRNRFADYQADSWGRGVGQQRTEACQQDDCPTAVGIVILADAVKDKVVPEPPQKLPGLHTSEVQ